MKAPIIRVINTNFQPSKPITSMKKVTATIAKALAETARITIRDKKNAITKSNEKSILQSTHFKKLQILHDKISEQREKFELMKNGVESKHKISIGAYRKKLEISSNKNEVPDVNELKNAIIIANHVEGIDESNVLSHVVKKYTQA